MSVTLFAKRVRWYLRALGFNPLIRASDRLEALAALAVLVTALLAVPAAARAGDLIYDADMRTANEQALTRHAVQAVAVDGSARMPVDFDSPAYVRAQWREGTHLRTEQVITPATLKPGESLKVWLDDGGKVVAAPRTPDDAKLSATVTAGSVWLAIVVCSAMLAFGFRRWLDGSRFTR